ncbi:MAG: DMT family transporter [Ideonella sp.]|nr:DMT family transporter [Ideonella sp.]MCC7456351.1 DMT family transporter [Nitrospira sp.]
MPAPLLMVAATLLFTLMGVAVKFASAHYGAAELVFYRSAIGVLLIGGYTRWRGIGLATPVPAMHFWRSASGVASLALWFHAIAGLPLGTAVALNYMSSVWMALFLLGGAVLLGAARVDSRLIAAVLVGFAGVALVLRPTVQSQHAMHGLSGLLSGVLAAMAYLQITALGRAGEPELRVVFYFSLGGTLLGAVLASTTGWHGHTWVGALQLLAIGTLATVAQTLMTHAYTRGSALTNASLQYLGIVFSGVFGVWLFGDVLGWMALLGMALIIAAGLAATYLQLRAPHEPPTTRPAHEA